MAARESRLSCSAAKQSFDGHRSGDEHVGEAAVDDQLGHRADEGRDAREKQRHEKIRRGQHGVARALEHLQRGAEGAVRAVRTELGALGVAEAAGASALTGYRLGASVRVGF